MKRHLSFANVVSCLALFMAMSGVAFAASHVTRNSVKAQHIKRGAVTAAKLRNGAVTTPKLRNGAVITAKLRNQAIISSKLADGSVRSVDLGGGVVTVAKLKDGAVGSSKLSNGSVTNPKLAADSVATGKVQDGAVTAAKLHPGLLGDLVRNVTYQASEKSPLDSDPKTITATCPGGRQAIAGGHRIESETAERLNVLESLPFDTAGGRTGWTVKVIADGAFSLEVHVVCAEL